MNNRMSRAKSYLNRRYDVEVFCKDLIMSILDNPIKATGSECRARDIGRLFINEVIDPLTAVDALVGILNNANENN